MMQRLVVPKAALSDHELRDQPSASLVDGQIRVRIDGFGLSTNNVTYAIFGDALGYWAFFPVDDDLGCIPVWGFADVVESTTDDVAVGERIFGYLPMATELVLTPTDVGDLAFMDASPHRVASHPWYNRYHRCAADPVWSADREAMQAAMWALFMTGWALAEELAPSVSTVVVSSASSKTMLSLAWTLQQHEAVTVVGLTSAGNVDVVQSTGVYDHVVTYDDLAEGAPLAADSLAALTGPAAFVDAAGNPAVRERVHATLGDRLVDSVGLGATHQGGQAASGEIAGPTPRFFFIPAVAETAAAEEGHAAFHGRFAEAWAAFGAFVDGVLSVESGVGIEAIESAYERTLAGEVAPTVALALSW